MLVCDEWSWEILHFKALGSLLLLPSEDLGLGRGEEGVKRRPEWSGGSVGAVRGLNTWTGGIPLLDLSLSILCWQFIDRGCRSDGLSLGSSVCTDPPSLQQSLQGFRLTGLMLTCQPGATSPGVHAARLPEAERAGHAAAAARLSDLLGAVFGQRFAQKPRSNVTRLASDHRSART